MRHDLRIALCVMAAERGRWRRQGLSLDFVSGAGRVPIGAVVRLHRLNLAHVYRPRRDGELVAVLTTAGRHAAARLAPLLPAETPRTIIDRVAPEPDCDVA